jgi:hypothetical protein
MQPYDFLLAKEASDRQRDIMIVKLKRLLDGKTFQLTDLANDLFLKNDQRNGVDVENPIELLNGIFI